MLDTLCRSFYVIYRVATVGLGDLVFYLVIFYHLLDEYEDPELYDLLRPPLRPEGDLERIHGSDHSSPLPCLSSALWTITSRFGLVLAFYEITKQLKIILYFIFEFLYSFIHFFNT